MLALVVGVIVIAGMLKNNSEKLQELEDIAGK